MTLFGRAGDPRVRIASDGAGGRYIKDPRLARVGWSAVAVLFANDSPDCDEVVGVGGYCGGITGDQTVPRAEAAGLTAAGRCCYAFNGPLGVLVDNQGAICQCYWPRKRAEASRVGDIWGELHEFQALGRGSLAANKNQEPRY